MSCRRLSKRIALTALSALSLASRPASSASLGNQDDLYQLSMQDLMKVEITSVSKKEQTLAQVAASIFVIHQEDIQRSGALNIPDLLRMVPGLDVAQVNANTWAISARGFNTQFSNKLLVIIDGRSVYTPTQDGVNWDAQDVPLEDIERIEVIRGPGATVWGANAVNGVINIITHQSKDTHGLLVTAGGGTATKDFGTLQYGGSLPGDADYRVFAKYLDVGNWPDITGGGAAGDGWHVLHGGFRIDKALSGTESLTAQGDIYNGREGAIIAHIVSISPPVNDFEERLSNLSGGNLLGRWTHVSAGGSNNSLQLYFDRYFRSGPESNEARNTVDVDFSNNFRLTSRQDLVWGAAYRRTADQIFGTIDQAYLSTHLSLQLYSAFVQDEIALGHFTVSVGTKVEHTDLAPFEAEPSVRMTFAPTADDTLWAAVSKAARTPARRDINSDINLGTYALPDGTPAVTTLYGNPRQRTEHLLSIELGYRSQFTDRLSVDITTFVNDYSDLRSVEPGAPFNQLTPVTYVDYPLVYANLLRGRTAGVELSAKLQVMERWTLSPGYAFLNMDLHTAPSSLDTTTVANTEGSSPRHQAQLRSSVTISKNFSWNASVAFVDRLPAQQIASYTRLDTQFNWRPTPSVDVSVVGQNLLHERHLESNDVFTSVNSSQIDRNAYAKVTWKFLD